MSPIEIVGCGGLGLSAMAGAILLLRCMFSLVPEHAIGVLYGVYIIGALVAFVILPLRREIAFYYGLSLLAASGILAAALLGETFAKERHNGRMGQMSALAIFNLVAGMIMYVWAGR